MGGSPMDPRDILRPKLAYARASVSRDDMTSCIERFAGSRWRPTFALSQERDLTAGVPATGYSGQPESGRWNSTIHARTRGSLSMR